MGTCSGITGTKSRADYKVWESTTLSNKYCYSYFGSGTTSFSQGDYTLKHKPDIGTVEAGVYWEWAFKTSLKSLYEFKIQWINENDQKIFIDFYDKSGLISTLDSTQIFARGMSFTAENVEKIVVSTIQKISSTKSSYE